MYFLQKPHQEDFTDLTLFYRIVSVKSASANIYVSMINLTVMTYDISERKINYN